VSTPIRGGSQMKTGFVWDESYMWHDTGSAVGFLPAGGNLQPDTHPENPRTKRRFKNLLDKSGVTDELISIDPRPATREELLRYHTSEYIDEIKEMSEESGGDAGELTPFGPGSYEIAKLAVGGVIEATDSVLDGSVDNAYVLARPPGHHAEADQGRGFCIFSNVALAAKHAREKTSVERVAIVDFDVHHGNGTEEAFIHDDKVLTISIHQDSNYPIDSGKLTDIGEGEGEGYTLNLPLPPGCGVGAYEESFKQFVQPALEEFNPDIIYMASGFDGSILDPLGRMMLHSDCYRNITNMLLESANSICDGRLVASHEGGYSTAYVPFTALATVEEMSGIESGVEDPFLETFKQWGYQNIQPHQQKIIEKAVDNLNISLRS